MYRPSRPSINPFVLAVVLLCGLMIAAAVYGTLAFVIVSAAKAAWRLF